MMHIAWSSIEEVPYCPSRSSIKFEGHTGQKITNFESNWAFPDSNFSLNSPMAMKWCIKLEEVPYCLSRSSIKFQGHTGQWIADVDLNLGFWTVTLVSIHRWLWNNAQSLKRHRIGALLFVKVIHQISRSPGTTNHWFWPKLSVSGQ